MKNQRTLSYLLTGVVFALAIISVWPQLAAAHHSFSALQTPEGEDAVYAFEGTVRAFRILNPHGALIIDAINETGNSEGWLLELSPASQLAREGWHEGLVSPGDAVTVSIFPAVTPNRARLRALLIPGDSESDPAQLLVTYGIRGDTPVMRRLRERLPVCGLIEPGFDRTECFLIDAEAATRLAVEFPGLMGYVRP
ncbi:MAG: hypothetical protein F4053_12345 [Proteobacteria bacterium]|nr:hypothetical protein [Pseudomonadota bacterium]MYJ96335.1 hypothetical protein [Pseudomonadota bacterium]